MELSPSLLSSNFYNIENDLNVLRSNNIKYIHLDVMDGLFVPNISFGMPFINNLKSKTGNSFIFDTHLMIERPERYIDEFKKAGADILTIHKESTIDFVETLSYIKSLGMKAGISIKPNTEIDTIQNVFKIADLILIMSVEPGFGGQKFIDSSLDKLRYLKELKNKNSYKFIIEIDGGINKDNIKQVSDAGAELIVVGSAIFNGDIKLNITNLKNI